MIRTLTNRRVAGIVAVALAVAAGAAPAAARPIEPIPVGSTVPVAPPALAVPVAPPILAKVPASQLAATERAREQALANHVPPTGRYSTGELNAFTAPVHTSAVDTPTLTAPADGFDWSDAAIGAGITAAIAVLITGGTLAVRQRSQPRHS